MIEWFAGLGVVLCNLFLCGAMLVVQQCMVRRKEIPERSSSFLYFQDFSRNTLGDFVGLSLFGAGFGILAVRSHATDIAALAPLAVMVGMVAMYFFYRGAISSSRKRSDWGFLRVEEGWKVTLGGKIHLAYFVLQSILVALFLMLALQGKAAGVPLLLATGGFVVYSIAFWLDYRKGVLLP